MKKLLIAAILAIPGVASAQNLWELRDSNNVVKATVTSAVELQATSFAGDGSSLTGITADHASNGTNCSTNQFNKGVDASGNAESCAALVDADVPNTITIDLAATATALAANGANCSAGQSPLGVDASGAAESCTDYATQTEFDAVTHIQSFTAAGLRADTPALGEVALNTTDNDLYTSTAASLGSWRNSRTGVGP